MISVARFSITPVKSLALHHPDEVLLEACGVAANRRFFLVREDGRLFSVTHHGPLVRVRAEWDTATERLSLAFPDGAVVADIVRVESRIQTDFWGGRMVHGRVVSGPWAAALSAFAGEPLRLVRADAPGGGVDVEPVTVSSTASAAEVASRGGFASPDGRRYRMLMELDGCSPHEEDSWKGRRFRAGQAVLEMFGPVDRCAATTRDPDTGIHDFDALRTIAAYRGLRDGNKIDFGVYARVLEPGRVRVGDRFEPMR